MYLKKLSKNKIIYILKLVEYIIIVVYNKNINSIFKL